jgi:hypothetical protein
MKIHRYTTTVILAAGALWLSAPTQLKAQSNFVVAAFATGTQGENSTTDMTGGQYAGDCLTIPYGAGNITWDGITYDSADGSTGSAYITAEFSGANNTDLLVSMAPGYNNWYFEGSSASCPSGTVDFTKYHAVQFDILWDTNSTLTIDQFNTGNNWPLSYLNGGEGSNYMATNSYYTDGVNVDLFTGAGGNNVYLGTFQVPDSASNGWQTVTMSYSDSLSGISSGAGLWFQGSFGGGPGINGGPYTAAFWIDNLVLVANTVVTPPPSLGIAPAVQGLNLFTDAGTALNQRQSLETVSSNYSWVGASGAVSYSFTISSYPVAHADEVGTYIFLIPSPATETSADYNEANVIFLDLESTTNGGASCIFRYKTNEPNGNTMIYSTNGTLAQLNNATAIGTWTLTFSNNTNVTITGPGGASTNFSIPDGTGATSALFASNVVVYYGTQGNNASGCNDHFVTSDFNITGLGSTNFDDNFLADDGTLNTNIWKVNATQSSCVRKVGPGNPYYVSWTLPSSGYLLQSTPTLGATRPWKAATANAAFTSGVNGIQLINTNDLSGGNSAYFAMIERNFSQLLILLPGETNAPGTLTGKSGTPTQQNTENLVSVTVQAVDSQFYPVGGSTDMIKLTSSDGAAILPNQAAMTNGTITFTTFLFQTDGPQVIYATDTTSTNIPMATSSSVVVAN